jgi:alanine dehydrogenase
VVIERGVGEAVRFQDSDYTEAGAHAWMRRSEVFKADLILKVGATGHKEIETAAPKQILISALQLNVQPKDSLRKLMEKKVTAVAWDFHQGPAGDLPDHSRHGRDRRQYSHPDRG